MSNKFGAIKTRVGGHLFDSKAEARRWQELVLLQRAGKISSLERQVKFMLVPRTKKPSGGWQRERVYVADFCYCDRTGVRVIEDVKGRATQIYSLKRALMLHIHGIEIKEVKA